MATATRDFIGCSLNYRDVKTYNDFTAFMQQAVGCPIPTKKDIAITRKKLNELQENYPDVQLGLLAQGLVEWAKTRHKRFESVWRIVACWKYAFKDGFLPDMNTVKMGELDELIEGALEIESDPRWRERLQYSIGETARSEVVEAWKTVRLP